MAFGDTRDLLELVARIHDAGGIARVAQHDQLCARRQRCHGASVHAELGRWAGGVQRLSACHGDEIRIQRVARLRNNDAITGIDGAKNGGRETTRSTMGDGDLLLLIPPPAALADALSNAPAQRGVTLRVGVVHDAGINGIGQSAPNGIRSIKVRITLVEADRTLRYDPRLAARPQHQIRCEARASRSLIHTSFHMSRLPMPSRAADHPGPTTQVVVSSSISAGPRTTPCSARLSRKWTARSTGPPHSRKKARLCSTPCRAPVVPSLNR